MTRYSIFISSPQAEFAQERDDLYRYFESDMLLRTFFKPVLFEKLPAAGQPPRRVYLEEIRQSQIYIGLIGRDYGY
jgi:ATP-dependent DNA helicase RecG